MTTSMRWKIAAAGATVVAAAAGGVAIAAARHPGPPAGPPSAPPSLGGFRDDDGGLHRGPFGGLDAAATYLGLTQQQLFQQLQSGKTLAQIAGSTSGKSVDGLVSAMVTAQKQRLEAAVSAERITRAQADQIEAQLQQRVTDMANGTLGRGPGPFGHRGFDHDGDHGGGPPSSAGTITGTV